MLNQARLAAAALGLLLIAGCSAQPTPPPATAPATSATPSLSPAPYGVPEQDDGDQRTGGSTATRTPLTVPTTDAARQDAAAIAIKAMTLYARRDIAAAQWIDDLAAVLTVQAAQDYAGTDPANVPPTAVTGPAKVIATDSAWLARVQVPTDVGLYLVTLSRTADDPTWRVARFTPPETAGD